MSFIFFFMKKLVFPNLRQTFNYDCGAKALQTVFFYYGIDTKENVIMKLARTSKSGTPILGIEQTIKKYGLRSISKKMTIDELKTFIDKKIPVIVAVQAWSKKKNVDWKKNFTDGHYVVVIGYDQKKFLFEDPAVMARTFLTYKEFEERWHDKIAGKKHIQHGIAIFGKNPCFHPQTMIHMD